MNRHLRLVLLALLAAFGIALVVALLRARPAPPLETTWTSSFQVLGAPVKLADRLVTRVLPISDVDEAQLGEVYRARFDPQARGGADQAYLDELTKVVKGFVSKPFAYRAYVVDDPTPNAMALPGGVVLVTRGLLSTLRSEGELVAVLAHEVGHIELGHCFDAARFALLGRKVHAEPLGSIVDFVTQVMLGHSYSKTMEHEADEYAFELLRHSRYDPRSVSGSFSSLLASEPGGRRRPPGGEENPIRDYFTSHPPLEIRADEFGQRAEAWWSQHPDDVRYTGRRNLSARTALSSQEIESEWAGRKPR